MIAVECFLQLTALMQWMCEQTLFKRFSFLHKSTRYNKTSYT